MKARSAILLILLILCFCQTPISAKLSATTRTPHFVIHHSPDLASSAAVIGDSCEVWLSDVSKKLGLGSAPGTEIDVYLYANQAEFRRATGHDLPGFVLGRASTDGYIELDISGTFATPEQVAGHEITHVLIFRMLGVNANALPLWANEGIAKYISNDWDMADETVLADAVTQSAVIALSSITHEFPSGSAQGLAYAEGASAIRFFVREYGERKLTELIKATGRTGSFDAAMQETVRLSASAFESNWRKSIDSSYGLSQFYRVARIIGAIVMPILAVLAFLGIQRRKRRTIEEDEEEDVGSRI